MNRTLHKQPTAPSSPSKKSGRARPRRRPMSAVLTHLEEAIVSILGKANGEPLSLRQIEEHLVQQGSKITDDFMVRDAVWSLIRKQRADLTPRRLVRATGA
jgi:hypothetical protein